VYLKIKLNQRLFLIKQVLGKYQQFYHNKADSSKTVETKKIAAGTQRCPLSAINKLTTTAVKEKKRS